MNIFEKRPLCLILCIGICGFLLFSFERFIFRFVVIAASILLVFLSLFSRKDKRKRTLLIAAACILLLASLLSYLYFDLTFKAYEKYKDEIEVVGIVEDISESSSYSLRLLVKVESISGEQTRGYHFYAYPTKTDAKGVIRGARICFKTVLDGFSDESYTYNISNGINAYAGDVKDLKILEYTSTFSLKFENLREYLTRYTINLSNSETGAILSALLLGERDYLPDQLRLDFKRIGISHILALSGMHLAILSLGIGKALSLMGIRKKTRVAVTGVFVMVYMALTGFSVSVVRAGLMLIISSILYLLSRTKDSLTSLSLAVVIICIASPNAIMDISLWLSALATFGIIAFSEFTSDIIKPKTKAGAIAKYFILAIMASVFAISSTLAVSTVAFGGFSIMAPIATIIFSFLAEIIMYLGCVMMLVGWLIPIGWLIAPLCKLMTFLAGVFSSIKLSYVSSNFSFAMIAIILYSVIFYLFLILKLKRPKIAFNIVVILYAITTLLPTIATVKQNHTETIAYLSDYKADEMLIRSKNEVCLINSSQYSKNLAYTSLDLLEDANVTHLDKYYLTHYSWSIDDEIDVLMYNISVEAVYIPEPRNEDEETILKILYKTVEKSRTKVVVFKKYETVKVGEYSINLLYSEPYGNTSMNAFTVAKGDQVYTYLSSGLLASANSDLYERYISLSDHVILGEHGKKYKNRIYLSETYEDLDSLIIQSENVFLLQNNMQFYLDKGSNIYSQPKNIIYFTK